MIETLLIKTKFNADVETISEKIGQFLNIDFAELRFSENVAGGRYLRAKTLGLKIDLRIGDSSSFPDYSFEIVIAADLVGSTGDLVGLADLVARVLAQNDMKVLRPLGPYIHSGAIEYGE